MNFFLSVSLIKKNLFVVIVMILIVIIQYLLLKIVEEIVMKSRSSRSWARAALAACSDAPTVSTSEWYEGQVSHSLNSLNRFYEGSYYRGVLHGLFKGILGV